MCTSSASAGRLVEGPAVGRRRAGSWTRRRAEVLRVEAGVPLFHRDMDEETIPLEAGIESRAISLTKGCYVGQEVIIRVLHRGHGRVAQKLVGLTLDGEAVPAAGASVMSARPCRRRDHDRRPLAGARPSDCARVRSARLHRAGHRAVGGRRRARRSRRCRSCSRSAGLQACRYRRTRSAATAGRYGCACRRQQLDQLRIGRRKPQRASSSRVTHSHLLAELRDRRAQSDGSGRNAARRRGPDRRGWSARISSPIVRRHGELFAKLACEARLVRLARLALAAGKLPIPFEMRALLPSRHEHAAVVFDRPRP